MSLIVAEGITKRWTDRDVLKNVCLSLAPQERVGLVGANGEGKTTLVRILAGLEDATEGRINRRGDLRIGYLPQDPPQLTGRTLHQAMLDVFADLHAMEHEIQEITHQLAEDPAAGGNHEKLLERYGDLQHQFEDRGGYNYANKIEQVLSGLNFERDLWEHSLAELSGGQRTRAYLAKLLLQDPEVLLLDEPTNHLDLATVEWLEKWLNDFQGALVVISHDRYFLDRVTNRTWEISFASLEVYKASYSGYLTQRQERFKERMRRWEAQQEHIAETQEFIRRFLAGQRSKEAQGRRTRLERFMKTEAIEKPREHTSITVRLHVMERTGDLVASLTDLQAGYSKDKPLVTIDHMDIFRGLRIAIVGPNGCGKTTLLRTVMGQLPALAGKVRFGSNVSIGYLSQTHDELGQDLTCLQVVRQIDHSITEERARRLLGSLLISEFDAFKKICELSGGQRSRVVLARLMLQKPNVLVLDEPTNHLDIQSQEVLQAVLSQYEGTIIFVSHDRYLIQALASDIWALQDGVVEPLKGDWDVYLKWRDEQMGLVEPASVTTQKAQQAKQDRKDDYQQRRRRTNEIQRAKRRLAEVEKEIHDLEDHIKATNDDLAKAGEVGDLDAINNLSRQYSTCDKKLQKLFEEWEQLSKSLEKFGVE
jgi:ATP-binding cassette subfamily F protein 3